MAAGMAACSGPGPSGGPPLPPSPNRLDVVMVEYRFDHVATVPVGRLVIEARNQGTVAHSLTVVALPDDFPPIVEQLRGETRRGVDTLAILPERPPGSVDRLAVDLLVPARYALICFVEDADGVTHARKGMASEFRVG
jgi:hypothetical protein